MIDKILEFRNPIILVAYLLSIAYALGYQEFAGTNTNYLVIGLCVLAAIIYYLAYMKPKPIEQQPTRRQAEQPRQKVTFDQIAPKKELETKMLKERMKKKQSAKTKEKKVLSILDNEKRDVFKEFEEIKNGK